jgi:hypothetical protein
MDLLVLADREGVVDMTIDAISRRTNVPEEIVSHAVTVLMSPDPSSRSGDEEGRRIVLIDSRRDWGWQIVNYEHYRNLKDEESRRAYFRDKKREQRAKSCPTLSNAVKDSPTLSHRHNASPSPSMVANSSNSLNREDEDVSFSPLNWKEVSK